MYVGYNMYMDDFIVFIVRALFGARYTLLNRALYIGI